MRVGEKETSEQAADPGAVRGSVQPGSARAPPRAEEDERRLNASVCTGCRRRVRVGSSRRSWPSATTRWRTRCSPSGSNGKERRSPSARRRRCSQRHLRTRTGIGSALVSSQLRPDSTTSASACWRLTRLSRQSSAASRIRSGAATTRSRSRSRRSLLHSTPRASARRPRSPAPHHLVRAPARPGPRRPCPRRRIRRGCAGSRPLEATYPKERSVPVCVATLHALGFDIEAERGIKLDLEDRPQKSPRACVIASDPPRLVHLITRAQGGLHDYEAFLHEAGHALHYAGCDPTLPLTFRRIARDHALTEIYSFLLDSIVREPGWHAQQFGLSRGAGARACRGNGVSRRTALPSLHGEARLRARLLVALRRRRRHARGIRGAADCGHRDPLSRRGLPCRHGRRLLLGRLPARLGTLGAAAQAPPDDGRPGLVAAPGDRRLPARACSARAPARRARRSRRGSASTRSTPSRWRPSCRG